MKTLILNFEILEIRIQWNENIPVSAWETAQVWHLHRVHGVREGVLGWVGGPGAGVSGLHHRLGVGGGPQLRVQVQVSQGVPSTGHNNLHSFWSQPSR